MREIELKIIIDEEAAQQLWARVRALRIATGRRKTRVLRSVYLDTSDHRLKEAGIHLRLRRDGRRWIQTIKTERDQHGGLSQASEVENTAPGKRPCTDSIPNPGMRDEVTRL